MEVLDGVFCDFEEVFPYAYEIAECVVSEI